MKISYLFRPPLPLWKRAKTEQKTSGYSMNIFIAAALMHFLTLTAQERAMIISDFMSMKGKPQ